MLFQPTCVSFGTDMRFVHTWLFSVPAFPAYALIGRADGLPRPQPPLLIGGLGV